MQVVILCGGQGTRLAEETEIRPKPMIEIGGEPILWHIMKHYSHHGFTEFVLCLGYKGDLIRDYFINYHVMNSDVRLHLGTQQIEHFGQWHDESAWSVLLAETGLETPTGGRLASVRRHLRSETFMVTYGDGVSDADLGDLLALHRRTGRLATVTAVRPSARFGELRLDGDRVAEFREKPQVAEGWVSGGFFVFEPGVLDRLRPESSLEHEILTQLAHDGELAVYRHEGYWRAMDTLREKRALEAEWASGRPGWKIW